MFPLFQQAFRSLPARRQVRTLLTAMRPSPLMRSRQGLDTNQPTADTCQRPQISCYRIHPHAPRRGGKGYIPAQDHTSSTLSPNNSAPSAELPDPKQRFVSSSSSSICVTRNSPEISHGTPDGNPKFGPEGRLGNRQIPLEQQNRSQLSDRFTIFL